MSSSLIDDPLYADKHTTYRSPAEPIVEEQLAGTKPKSQFGRALRELEVELIAAHSPQVEERMDGTLRLTSQGRSLDFQAIAARPESVVMAKPQPRSHCPVTPKLTYPRHKQWREERGPHPAAGP